MRIHVLGLGPIGCVLSHSLRRVLPSQHSITLIHKTAEERRQAMKKNSLCIEQKGHKTLSEGYSHEVSVKQLESTSLLNEEEIAQHEIPIDSLFVALKAQHTVSALKDLSERLNAKSTVVLFQNGMGIYEQLISQVFRNPLQRPQFVIASNTHGAYIKNFFHVVHAGLGSIEFGIAPDPRSREYEAGLFDETIPMDERRLRISDITSPDDKNSENYTTLRYTVAALLLMQDLNITWRPLTELRIIMQRKLAVNAAINPLTALFGCRNGELFKTVIGREILYQICAEASAVYSAELAHDNQVELQKLRQEGIDTKDIQLPSFPNSLTKEALVEHVLQVADFTAGNLSSMLQDVQRGRKTEIEFINGYLEQLGQAYGVPTPVNATLRDLIKLKYLIPVDQFI
ncbi:2-dehydropantoate 2-reductase [Pholiota conissans]|uniref:2-dehydropantoate 2-reductase n=1 Tax=Pholiota conissans TaxID=109636 RepID=A0A9P5ZIF4_9AGAR|nr:2-dehydropantoate 2-reductase [Pholiota conissans]